MYLIFDTETSNFPNNNLAVNHPDQGRIVQLAWLLLDEKFEEVGAFNSLIHVKDKFRINPGAAAAHGKTVETCDRFGMPAEVALAPFNAAYYNATTIVAHNIAFDRQLIDIEEKVLWGKTHYNWTDSVKHKCTMLAMTPICKLTGKYPGKYKWPKLQEAYEHCFGKEFDGAHDALADVRATAAVFKWLIDNGHKV